MTNGKLFCLQIILPIFLLAVSGCATRGYVNHQIREQRYRTLISSIDQHEIYMRELVRLGRELDARKDGPQLSEIGRRAHALTTRANP